MEGWPGGATRGQARQAFPGLPSQRLLEVYRERYSIRRGAFFRGGRLALELDLRCARLALRAGAACTLQGVHVPGLAVIAVPAITAITAITLALLGLD